ncbi:hypothetical protein NE865_04130 [Phthorimaea operculella]|nr:hypothetical protein NE865_07535 [Phthorimaea operculella]KAI5643954.1 hypothetical protein NE865_04130 [Phthorimaea operculella]
MSDWCVYDLVICPFNPFDSDAEERQAGAVQPKRKALAANPRHLHRLRAEEELREQEPVRASALRSFLSRRTGSGVSFQRDYTRQGEYYVELRVYSAREAERLGADRWKTALISYKGALYPDSPTWKATTELVKAAKREFQSVQPILYPNQVI